jgi:hypothetical protein
LSVREVGTLAILVVACVSPPRPVHKAYLTDITCAWHFEDHAPADSALGLLDVDGDGQLTAADLRSAESGAIFKIGGTNADSPSLSSRGFTASSTLYATLAATGEHEGHHRFSMPLNCMPTIMLTFEFNLPSATGSDPIRLPVKSFDAVIHIDAAVDGAQVRGADGAARVIGHFKVLIVDGRASGWFVGEASVQLAPWNLPDLPYDVADPTGQVFELRSVAFRDIEVQR